ncbi:unnamed protein product, partial [marine sediment metagenome]
MRLHSGYLYLTELIVQPALKHLKVFWPVFIF